MKENECNEENESRAKKNERTKNDDHCDFFRLLFFLVRVCVSFTITFRVRYDFFILLLCYLFLSRFVTYSISNLRLYTNLFKWLSLFFQSHI